MTVCRFCGAPAVAVFALSDGCVCYEDDTEQALCMQHVVKATPFGGLDLVTDLSVDEMFTRWWER